MSYAPKKVFILENGKYVEITNEEHNKRKADDQTIYIPNKEIADEFVVSMEATGL